MRPIDAAWLLARVGINEADFRGLIECAPTIKSPRDWTPCAEGLPEETGKYWVTFFYYGAAFAEKRDYFAHEKRWGQGGKPVAWMRTEAKPDPYNPDHIRDAGKED